MRHFYKLLWFAAALHAAPADWIWSARYVVTMDARHRVIEDGAVAIVGDHIAAVGTRAEIDRAWQPKQRLDRPDAILAPGLINGHTHAAMSLLRGIADDLNLQDWLEKYIFPAEAKNVNAEFVRWGTRLACLEMALSGTTTYVDMYYFEDTVAEETKAAGLRGILGETVIGFPVAGLQNAGRCDCGNRRVPQEVGPRSADCSSRRAARVVYQHSGDSAREPAGRRRESCAAGDPSGGNQEGE